MSQPILTLEHVWKSYALGSGRELHALHDVSLEVAEGSVLAVIGRSGSGKSTLLHVAAGIDEPTSGTVRLGGEDVGAMADADRTRLRRGAVGLVFQFFHLLPHLQVLDNVLLPALVAGTRTPEMERRADALLDRVGLAGRASASVHTLSGGEMQRVALCRALVMRPRLLLADEPTGNLDHDTGEQVMTLLLELAREERSTLIYVTHSRELASRADSVRWMQSGVLDPA